MAELNVAAVAAIIPANVDVLGLLDLCRSGSSFETSEVAAVASGG
jgi:hypothetical protein